MSVDKEKLRERIEKIRARRKIMLYRHARSRAMMEQYEEQLAKSAQLLNKLVAQLNSAQLNAEERR